MITQEELTVLFICMEGLLYGKVSILCFNLYPAKEVQLFLGLGIYSGIFAIYLHCTLKESRTTTIVFYTLCLLYVLSTGTFVCDLLFAILDVSNNSICKNIIFLSVMQMHVNTLPVQLQIDSQSMLFRLTIVQGTVNSCCDFIAQCTLVCINHFSH